MLAPLWPSCRVLTEVSIAKALAMVLGFFSVLAAPILGCHVGAGEDAECGDARTVLIPRQVRRLVTGVAAPVPLPRQGRFFRWFLVTDTGGGNQMLFRDHPGWPQGNTWCSES